ncbi:hypothetical protein [Ferrimonas kyonanensis]|uniref:hypothetical protein n=1 Tax=Ferrimonas kyonanensis TaxID=364763 RepID=UPI00040C959F|nr:hypothetical protein [Ferrimonas kyonanensis]
MSHQKIDFISLSKLELDKDNPRLPSQFRKGRVTQEKIVNWMLEDASIIELMLAIGQQGFFIGESLLVIEEKNKYVVIEGNRRLTSTILLSNPDIAKVHKKKISKVLSETPHRPQEIPCIVFKNRAEITKYLGYRHVTGIKSWGILPKARYLNQLKSELDAQDFIDQCRELAKSIGSRSDYVRKLLVAYAIYEIVEDEAFFRIRGLDETTIYFNYYSDSLSRDNIRNFINVDMASSDPTANVNVENLKLLTTWFFEKNENQRTRLLGDSKHLSMLDKVLSDECATEYFKTGSGSIQDAYDTISVTTDSFNQKIDIALSTLKQANDIIHKVDKHHESVNGKLKEIFRLAKNMKVAIESMADGEWDD